MTENQLAQFEPDTIGHWIGLVVGEECSVAATLIPRCIAAELSWMRTSQASAISAVAILAGSLVYLAVTCALLWS